MKKTLAYKNKYINKLIKINKYGGQKWPCRMRWVNPTDGQFVNSVLQVSRVLANMLEIMTYGLYLNCNT